MTRWWVRLALGRVKLAFYNVWKYDLAHFAARGSRVAVAIVLRMQENSEAEVEK